MSSAARPATVERSADSERPHAVVVGLDTMQGLQTARLLSRRGVPVIAITGDPHHPHCSTRVVERILAADPASEELVARLAELGSGLTRKAVLFPCHDNSVLMISRHRSGLANWYHIVLPPEDVVEMMMDKVRFYAFAQERGLPIPTTFLLRDRADAEGAADRLSYPCILKPPYRATARWGSRTRSKAFKAHSARELLELFDRFQEAADVLIAQEWIPGGDADLFSCNLYIGADGEPLVTFVARKLRQWPPEVGQSSLGEECRNDEVLRESLRLFGSVAYRGLGYVELKRDPRSGRHVIIEPNVGRPTGRSAIAEGGGVELLYTMYCDALGRPLPTEREQRYLGVKWIHLLYDLGSAIHYGRRGELTLAQWWASIRGPKVYALFSWSDPAPMLRMITRGARKAAIRSWRRRATPAAGPQPPATPARPPEDGDEAS